jgi:hypothetical protein
MITDSPLTLAAAAAAAAASAATSASASSSSSFAADAAAAAASVDTVSAMCGQAAVVGRGCLVVLDLVRVRVRSA